MGVQEEHSGQVRAEREKRRTFAIISHPDAGKTTLTEKLLLYAGMIRTAGMVQGRKDRKGASSDWMQMEQERGISITASAMQFHYKNVVINVLDTPGHQDFSEDTYRTLTAADSAVMVIDAAKGVEAQTRKLFQVCRLRGIPLLTFVNKMDLPGREPLDLISEVEEVLSIQAAPVFWPIGSGEDFCGIIDILKNRVIFFEGVGKKGAQKALLHTMPVEDVVGGRDCDREVWEEASELLSLVKEAGNPFQMEAFLAGKLTPVFFGSALTNYAVEPFFDSFTELAPSPRSRIAYKGEDSFQVNPDSTDFSGYVFKIQANMDLKHRDSMAYIRVCSGRFERDCVVKNSRTGKEVRLSRSHNMFGGERNTLDTAYPGDIVGVVNPGVFHIGDTITASSGAVFRFQSLPKFPPEVVARLRPKDSLKRKAFIKGIEQFRSEGAVLILDPIRAVVTDPLVAAVGPLQFEVLGFRLENEYGVKTDVEMLPYRHGAWLLGDVESFDPPSGALLAKDAEGQVIMLYSSDWERHHALEKNKDHRLVDFIEEGSSQESIWK